jgi:DNA-binding protein HU-beta
MCSSAGLGGNYIFVFLRLPRRAFAVTTLALAESVGLTKKQAVECIEALVALACKNAKNTFTLPGLGKLVLVNRKARMGRNPATGETIKIAAKRVVKFRVAKAAKDAILGKK